MLLLSVGSPQLLVLTFFIHWSRGLL